LVYFIVSKATGGGEGGAAPPLVEEREGSWSLNRATISGRWGLWDTTQPYSEDFGAATLYVRPDPGEKLISVRFELIATRADEQAVEKLATRREALAQEVPIFGDLLLIGQEERAEVTPGIGHRFFDMSQVRLVTRRGVTREPCWAIEPAASGYFVTSEAITTGGRECRGPWHLANRTSSSLTGLLEVGKPVTVSLLFSVPDSAALDGCKLRIGSQSPVGLRAVANNYQVDRTR
jgi:hypothetical protein